MYVYFYNVHTFLFVFYRQIESTRKNVNIYTCKLPADVEFKLLQQNKTLRPHCREPEQKKN